MSILIKSLEMPTHCTECLFWHDGVFEHCIINESIQNEDLPEYAGEYPEACPLVSVPPHGRLIDADAVLRRYDYELSRTYTDDFAKGFQLGVKAAVGNGTAVVIEAEEGE